MGVEAVEAVGAVMLQVIVDCGGSDRLDGLDGTGVDGKVSGDYDLRPCCPSIFARSLS